MYRVKVSWKVNAVSGSVIQDVPGGMLIKDHFEGTKSSIVKNIHVLGHRKLVNDLVLFTEDKNLLDMSKTFEEIFDSHDKREELKLQYTFFMFSGTHSRDIFASTPCRHNGHVM